MSTYPECDFKEPEFSSLLAERVKQLEFWRTSMWAIHKILDRELMTHVVIDPCAGDGRMGYVAATLGHHVIQNDIYPWVSGLDYNVNYLEPMDEKYVHVEGSDLHRITVECEDATVFINPPFSRAVEFIEAAKAYGARKIICFQRWAWYESVKREAFWDANPPNRIYLCGSRATCWMASIGPKERKGGTDKAYGWYVWERGQTGGPVIERIYND